MKLTMKKQLKALLADVENFQRLTEKTKIIALYNQLVEMLDDHHELKGIADTYEELNNIAEEEREFYEDRSDRWKEGENGEAFLESLERIETVRDNFDSVKDYFENLSIETLEDWDERIEALEEARGELITLIEDY